MGVNVTKEAMAQIDKLCIEHAGDYVRLAILSGGCHGFTKVFDFSTVIETDDTVIQCLSGKLLIDNGSLTILEGSIIDYKDTLMGSYFVVEVPNSDSCGCGTSFSV